ncbi:MAG: bifunctional tetrahydrofolate synthase/dihydrofolate synthase, partial [Dokdonella sp.]
LSRLDSRMTTPRTLAEWLEYQQRIHPHAIAMGLERISAVWQRLGSPRPAPLVVTVAGTNGKGSTVAFIEGIGRAYKCRVGAYTSPHLLHYNERIRVNGAQATDVELIAAFERIEVARGEIQLTYFEFCTLAALLVFAAHDLDLAVLEVGLGGRLDAVNIVDADVSVVTTIDFDHQDLLGDDLDAIAREKAGIFRSGRPAVICDPSAPCALKEAALAIGATVVLADRDFHVNTDHDGRMWNAGDLRIEIPVLPLVAPVQALNAAGAIAVFHALRSSLDWQPECIREGLATARIPARIQCFPGPPEIVVDVAHNPQVARALGAWLEGSPARGAQIAVFAALADKDIEGIIAPVREHFAHWYIAGLERCSPRGLEVESLRQRVEPSLGADRVTCCVDVDTAMLEALGNVGGDARIVAFGSFFVAADALNHIARTRHGEN